MEKKKLDGRTILVASVLFIAIFAQVGFLGSVLGPIGLEHNIWGTTSKAGISPPGSDILTPRNITAWIDGVNYGDNWTWDNGNYDLYAKGDDWGLPGYNYVKDGGWNGDLIYYFLDYDPMDYFLNISSHTSTFDDSAYEQVDPIYFDTQTDTDFNLGDTSLRGIKINEIVITPGDAGNQYVYLYDWGGDLTQGELVANYYLQKCNPIDNTPYGPSFVFAGNASDVVSTGGGLYYVELPAVDFLNSQDELKLIWNNPGGSQDNICNGTDVIVDRAEWGEYHNNIGASPPDDREYDNTTMADYPSAPGLGQGLVRRDFPGNDSDDCSQDFTVLAETGRAGVVYGVEYIEIVDTADTGATTIPLTITVDVGVTITGYAAAFNSSAPGTGYLYDVSVTWTVVPSGSEDASTNPGSGTSSDFYSGKVGGTVDWIADYGGGITYTITVTINPPVVDYIEITDTPDGTPLAGGPVGSGFTEWGYCSAYNNSVGYIGVVSADWTAEGSLSVGLLNATPNIHNGIDVGTDTADVWLNASFGGKTDSVMYSVTGGGVPGAPTDLRVHKGGGAWGGIAGDLVLEWLAPSSDYVNLTANIVYYDMDLSDGFQYTTYVVVGPNATGPGTPDGCLLPGWEANPNNYAFIVRTTGDVPGGNENPTGTNVGYKYIMTLLKNPTTTSQLVVSIPYFSDRQMASDITGPGTEFPNADQISLISRWNYTRQTYDSRSWNPLSLEWEPLEDFEIMQGDTLIVAVSALSPYEWSIVGAYDDTFEFVLQKNPTTTSQTFAALPYHKSYVMASDVCGPGTEFTNADQVSLVSQWNYARQTYDSRGWNPLSLEWEPLEDFAIFASPGDHLVFTITTTSPYNWQPQVITL